MGYIEYAIIIEELSRVDGSIGIIVAAHNSLCTNHIFKFGSEEQRKNFVTPLAQGKSSAAGRSPSLRPVPMRAAPEPRPWRRTTAG